MTKSETLFMNQAAFMTEDETSVVTPTQLARFFVDSDAPSSCIKFGNRLCMVAGTDLKFSRPVVMWLASLSRTQEQVAMWAYTLIRATWNNDGQPVLMSQMMRLLDKRVPGVEAYRACWESQMVGDSNQNLLDRSVTYKK
jgi:hypothetical protein